MRFWDGVMAMIHRLKPETFEEAKLDFSFAQFVTLVSDNTARYTEMSVWFIEARAHIFTQDPSSVQQTMDYLLYILIQRVKTFVLLDCVGFQVIPGTSKSINATSSWREHVLLY
jgi:hypothetical protein